jgi:septation ring formation regulator EzrA
MLKNRLELIRETVKQLRKKAYRHHRNMGRLASRIRASERDLNEPEFIPVPQMILRVLD